MAPSRRKVLGSIGSLGALSLSACASAPASVGLGKSSGRYDDLFTLGVASGDPVSDGFVIWTRLAPEPMAENGGLDGPMPVVWQVAEDEKFHTIIRQGQTRAVPQWAHSVHVEVAGLSPLRPYYYRFIADGQTSPVGRAKTAPPFKAPVEQVRFGYVSCQHFEQGFFTPYDHLVADEPDFIVHLGDYIYESTWGPQIRRHPSAEALSLTDYRQLHATYKSDRALQAAHAAAPWLMIWDDHEVVNDYAGFNDENFMPEAEMRARRAAAYQAYYEHMPVRLRSRPNGPYMRMHDYFFYGDLMTMALTDGRQFRDNQACISPTDGGGRVVHCAELQNPTRSMFGKAQEQWLMPSFARSGAIWEVFAHITLFCRLFQKDNAGIPGAWSDGWDGYPFTRKMILDAVAQRKPKNFVAIGGDMHSWWQADLKTDFNNPDSPTIGTEFVCSSVTSHSYAYNRFMKMLPDNPHIHFFDDRKRGYCLVNANRDRWQLEMKEVDTIYTEASTVSTRKRYVVESGRQGAVEA